MPDFTEADTIRILVATDNHVGFQERDAIRKDDAWKTFDEIMQLARTEDVDMVLLGGDLFHDNKPSRKAMYQVMRSLRKNCLGMKPCELEFLSDANEVFESAFSHVNYHDPDINVSIPVFSIHGNHDDPTGDGHFCSLDLLQVAGLVNYFGKVPEADNIEVRPVLLQKGQTKLALYGLSNVRDERMHRTFRDNKVKWFRPDTQAKDFFKILTLHQNHHAHTPTGYLPENALPDFLDLVIWGHEHECLIDPRRNPETGFHVMQPGSSVATSLVPGEAVPKHVAIVGVTGKDFRVEKIPLKTVRPFITREIVLATDKRFKGVHKQKENRQEITKRLMAIVEEMIGDANDEWNSLHGADVERGDRPLPLVRLKVDYTAPEEGNYDCENPQRFSNRFAGLVANVNDVVYFHRKKTATRKEKAQGLSEDVAETLAEDIRVDALVAEFLAAQSLKILPQRPFGDAVNQFVNKDDKHAMDTFVNEALAGQVKGLLALNPEENDLDTAMEEWRKKREAQFVAGLLKASRRRVVRPKPDEWDSDLDGHWEDQPGAVEYVPIRSSTPPPRARAPGRTKRAVDSDSDFDMFVDDHSSRPMEAARGSPPPAPKTSKAAPAKKAPAAAKKAPARGGRGKKANKGPFIDDDDQDDFMEVDEPSPKPPPKRPVRTSARTRQTTLNFSQSQNPATQKALEISDDEISEEDEFESMPVTRSRRR